MCALPPWIILILGVLGQSMLQLTITLHRFALHISLFSTSPSFPTADSFELKTILGCLAFLDFKFFLENIDYKTHLC